MPVRPPNPDNIRSTLLNAAHIDHEHEHDDLTGVTSDQHHAEAHTVASHSDTTATGAELETLTDGSDADALHAHATLGPTLTEEEVEDFVGGMLTGNTETLITVTYQDGDGTIDFVVDNDLSNYDNVPGWIAGITGEPLSDLSDVTITAIGTDEILQWNGSAWINQTLAEAGISETGHSHTESDVTDLGTYLENVVEDTTPQLGGELDADGNNINNVTQFEGVRVRGFELTDKTGFSAIDTYENWGSENNVGSVGESANIFVNAVVTGSILSDSGVDRAGQVRVGISLDGGSTFTYGPQNWCAGYSTGGLRRNHAGAAHSVNGIPTGNIRVQVEARISGGATTDLDFVTGHLTVWCAPA